MSPKSAKPDRYTTSTRPSSSSSFLTTTTTINHTISSSMSPINIFSLPSRAGPTTSLRDEIEAGLAGRSEPIVPGNRTEDRRWSFKRNIPTVVLYDEQGLKLYDRITSDAPEYYLFPDEMNLLKTHGPAIARAMGFPGRDEKDQDQDEEQEEERDHDRHPQKPWKPARWGDAAVGKWNNGVNGEEGLGGGWQRGWDVVELGAGALRKTAYLLTALSSALPSRPSNADSLPPPITYHPLDLSRPELHRVLGEMDEAFGQKFKGKIDCIGLHGDYDGGLQFIREGRLASLRNSFRGRSTLFNNNSAINDESSPDFVARIDKALGNSPPLSPNSTAIVTPGPEVSPLPSGITDDMSRCSMTDESGTWSPVEDSESLAPIPPRAASPIFNSDRPLHLVFLGSSIGNFSRETAAPFLKSLPLRKGDSLLLGLDGRPVPGEAGNKKVTLAYNDPAGHTRAFEEHGWEVVRKELGLENDPGVEFVGRYNDLLGRHEAYFRSKGRQTLHLPNKNVDVTLEEGELLNIEWSYKYSLLEALELFEQADLRVVDSWKAPDSEYRLWLLERPYVHFSASSSTLLSNTDNPAIMDNFKGVPKWEEWLELWKLWDHITLDMIPPSMLHKKPIDLRHICLFYLGHIPTFLDIHLTRMTNGSHTEPEHFKDIFERGIDPDVDDPTKIHSHSEVPVEEADWPALDEILAFRDRVRQRLRGIYNQINDGQLTMSRHIGRVLFMTFEHEAMHAETLLYMLFQAPFTLPPTAVAKPQWEVLAKRWEAEATPKEVISLSGGTVVMGHDDLEEEDKAFPDKNGWADHEFGWDNENPKIEVEVKPFKVDSLPVSNGEYRAFLESIDVKLTAKIAPASWVEVDGVWHVRTLYGPVAFEHAAKWPLMASKNELDAFARSKGGRLPTEAELRFLWTTPEGPRPAGVAANVGFKNWHLIPPANTVRDHSGAILHGHNGGVWEWTDTPFAGYEGYVGSEIYPGYSADFFDGKHYVVLGGSFTTISSIAQRPSFRNWYQANYRFAFIGGRVAYDV
ncbi:hypothetical protein BCR39DRAFT_554493 [Naematelia encephala]|uniref:C-type lectin protein n=1 Tax=Naematelia encephala TaxID=71784 RepID=A0A1Y2AEB5_9TREE|nr:hypothetical protein BCR39DRAFT_554493 [Naematelia encephala]